MRPTALFTFAIVLMAPLPALAVDAAIQGAVHASNRTAKLVARDGARHPAEELSFFGVTPHSTVVEIWPGGGYWTEILAPLLRDSGTYYLAFGAKDGDRFEAHFSTSPTLKQVLDSQPAVYDRIKFTTFGMHHPDLAPPNSADVVLTFRNLHNWLEAADAAQMLTAIRRALKPGGILGIEDHRGNTNIAQDPNAASGYVRQDYAIKLIERAGFTLVGSSEMDANPRDTANWPKGVWTLPPTYAMKAVDHAKYEAVGEADNFVLKFRKTGS